MMDKIKVWLLGADWFWGPLRRLAPYWASKLWLRWYTQPPSEEDIEWARRQVEERIDTPDEMD